MAARFLPCGDSAILIETDSLVETLELFAALDVTRPAGVVDLVPGARTVLVIADPARTTLAAVREWASAAGRSAVPTEGTTTIRIPVRYDGEDLGEVAALLGLAVEEVIERHTASTWTVAFGGFAPGFAYLVSDHPFPPVPRRSSPRLAVPAGAVALAGEFGGVYPRASPGGWQLIGSTDAALWDPNRDRPALLTPGTIVRFVKVTQ